MLKLHLSPFFGSRKLAEIGPAEIEAFKAKKLAEGQSKRSINNHLTALRKVLSLAAEWNVIPKAPKVKGFKVKYEYITEDQFFSFEEAKRLVRAAPSEWRTFVIVALKTGLRVGELLALKWEDVDLVAGQIIVRRTLWCGQEGPPKGGSNRKVPLSDEAIAALKADRHLKGPYVFCDGAGNRLSHSMVKDVGRELMAEGEHLEVKGSSFLEAARREAKRATRAAFMEGSRLSDLAGTVPPVAAARRSS